MAIAALVLVLGYRLARPERAREWAAVGAYAVALAAQVLGAQGLLPGAAFPAGVALRIAGAALLVAGLVVAGTTSRAKRRFAIGDARPPAAASRWFEPTHAGLALVVLGQLLRAPSTAGAFTAVAAVAVNLWVALTERSGITEAQRSR